MKWKVNVDRTGIATVSRTTSALLLGNSIVIPVLTEGRSHYWWVLLAAGACIMVLTNITVERKMP